MNLEFRLAMQTPPSTIETDEPGPKNNFLAAHAELLISSFFRLTGKALIEIPHAKTNIYQALYDADFCVVSHNTENDPIFNYGNRAALNLFEMRWVDFIKLASKKSAELQNREERDNLLARVSAHGFIEDYQGVRVSATGKRFFVENSIVWNVLDEKDHYCGQAAVLYRWSRL